MQKYASRLPRYVRSKHHLYLLSCLASLLTILVVLLPEANAQTPPPVNITTYHYDNMRTGWNNQEASLTPTTVKSTQFKRLQSIALDEQVDAQPLLLTNKTINGTAYNEVVYVATENNTIYAFDATSGTKLLTRNLGTPVPIASLPGACDNNSTVLGVASTPVIDPSQSPPAIYVMSYQMVSGAQAYMLYKLDATTLNDIVSPVTVSPSQKLSDGSTTYSFKAVVSRQRPALLLAGGNVYAAFTSFCDHQNNIDRGWVWGWNAATLAPMSYLTDRQVKSSNTFFLSSIWMSGYGPAADEASNLFFATSNSDPKGKSYSATFNLEESVIKLSNDLSTVIDYFTPANFSALDGIDKDFGAGGVMILPQQPGAVPSLAVAAGKDGRMFLLDRTNLGKLSKPTDKVVGTFQIGTCFCGQSYFTGSDGVGRIVSSGGKQIRIWRVQTSPKTTLVQENVAPRFPNQNNGSFTTISSNLSNNPIIWSVERPAKGHALTARTLYAFDATTGLTLTSIPSAGVWSHLTANANIVPVVANGKVYVASDKLLNIFGLSSVVSSAALRPVVAPAAAAPSPLAGLHRVSGTVTEVKGSFPDESFTISTRTQTTVRVSSTQAARLFLNIPVAVGDNVELQGFFDSAVFQATVISHAMEPDAWLPDL